MKYYKLLYDYEHEDNSIFLEIDEKPFHLIGMKLKKESNPVIGMLILK